MILRDGPIRVDLGTSTVTGVRAPGAPELAAAVGYVGHATLQTIALDAADTAVLGSHYARTGLLHERKDIIDDTFTDPLGIEWLWAEGSPGPLNHPLEDADYLGVAKHPRPVWPDLIQLPDTSKTDNSDKSGEPAGVVADAPVSGLLETCFGLRGSWQFMMDTTENWRVANALLDWSLETVASAYERMLSALPAEPDLVLYGDDYGYQAGMFLSDKDFRTFVRPRLQVLFSRIRRVTAAPICFHCCGAVAAILPDLAELGAGLLNLQYDAKGMELENVRKAIPADMVLHGYTDLRALGVALADGDRKSVAVLADELASSAPAIAAPVDCLATEAELLDAARGARFVRALSATDLAEIRRLGPVASILDRAAREAGEHGHERPSGIPPTATRMSGGTGTGSLVR
jgi:hypothetical protein